MLGRTDLKILRDIIDSFFLYYCTTDLIFDGHVIFILAPRYVLHVHVWALRKKIIKFDTDPFRWDVLMTSLESSDRWNNEMKCLAQEVVLQEFQGTHSGQL